MRNKRLTPEQIAAIAARQEDGLLAAHDVYGYILLTVAERDALCEAARQVVALRHCWTFVCACGDEFDSVERLREHVAAIHGETPRPEPGETP